MATRSTQQTSLLERKVASRRMLIVGYRPRGAAQILDALAALCKRRKAHAVYAMPTLHKPLSWIWADGPIEKPRERLHDSVDANGIVTGKRIDDIAEPASLAEPRNESVTRVCQCVEGHP